MGNLSYIQGARFTELLFSHVGDENGAFYWIATQGKTKRWANPHKVGLVKVSQLGIGVFIERLRALLL